MQPHTKVYLNACYPDHCQGEYIPCEVCGAPVEDIHHIDARGMGGTKKEYTVEGLMGLCSHKGNRCHQIYGDKKQYMKFLVDKHRDFLDFIGYPYDESKFPKNFDISEK